MEDLRLKIKDILMNGLDQKSKEDQLMDLYQENKLVLLINENNEFVWINIEEIIYIIKLKKTIECHTIKSIYLHNNKTQIEIEDLLFNENFIMCDNKSVVNVHRVKKYDSYKNVLYFEEKINQDSKRVSTTRDRIRMFKKILGSENDVVEPDNLIHTHNHHKKPLTIYST